jgi:pimeloyl-ACP methyl ester carboxylesterase
MNPANSNMQRRNSAMDLPVPVSGFADVDGGRLYYETAGTGRPLVLLHAGIADSRMWDAQMAAFAPHYQVIRYDQRGYGLSSVPDSPYAPARDLQQLLHYLGVGQALLVGLSGGGLLALDFTLEYPEMVAAMVLTAPGLSGFQWSSALEAQSRQLAAALERGDVPAAVDLWLALWVEGPAAPAGRADPAVRDRMRELLTDRFSRPPGQGEPRLLEPPAIGRLAAVACPTLIVAGDQDVPDILRNTELLQAKIPGARRVVLPNVAHMVNLERPAEFNALVLDFFQGR